MPNNPGCGRAFWTVVCVVLGLVLTGLIAATVYAYYILNLMPRDTGEIKEPPTKEQIEELMKEETIPDNVSTAPVVREEDVDWGEEVVDVIETDDNIVNFMLIGQDARSNGELARSDSMILVTINKEAKTITLTSFLRDLYVKIPGYGDNKMNAAYALGGMKLLNETLEQNFGVQVEGNVEVNFNHFAEVIDALGGVDMELRQDEAGYINIGTGRYVLGSGMQHLDGEQALFYSRIRHLDADADFSRTNRQRKVINALIEKFRSTDVMTLMGLLKDILPMITTDLRNSEIIDYATDLLPILADCKVVSQRVPADGKYYFATINQMSCVVADMDAARELLKQTMGE